MSINQWRFEAITIYNKTDIKKNKFEILKINTLYKVHLREDFLDTFGTVSIIDWISPLNYKVVTSPFEIFQIPLTHSACILQSLGLGETKETRLLWFDISGWGARSQFHKTAFPFSSDSFVPFYFIFSPVLCHPLFPISQFHHNHNSQLIEDLYYISYGTKHTHTHTHSLSLTHSFPHSLIHWLTHSQIGWLWNLSTFL